MRLSGWGRSPVVEGRELVAEDLERLTRDVALTRGLGRSYGDSSLPATAGGTIASTRLADRILAFDSETGVLRAEAGLSLFALNRALLERGWFTPVSPGTQFVTLGGMVASDVHGKNHHEAGTFGRHVSYLRMRVGNGDIVETGPDVDRELFDATVGGMGLTGHVLEVEVRLKRIASPWIWSESETARDFESLAERLVDAGRSWPYTVAWADLLHPSGRGILVKGRWAEPGEAPAKKFTWPGALAIPFDMPGWAINPLSMRMFNALYLARHGRRTRTGIVHPQSFFYPLDAILDWNRAYGSRGFTQYQCIIPKESGVAAAAKFARLVRETGGLPCLVVVKDFGPEGPGLLSFPRPGLTFAIDLPVTDATPALVARLNDVVAAGGGRVYLTKDAFTSREHFRAMEPRLAAFDEVRRRWDPERTIRSAQSARLLGDNE
jgi:FAD/FMN-containing dehydrogenase